MRKTFDLVGNSSRTRLPGGSKMIRFLRLSVAVAFLAALVSVFPAMALANHTDTCQSPSTWRTYVGRTAHPTGSATGVRADIDVGAWGLCSGATPEDFLYSFVDIGADNGGCQVGGSCLVQFGIVRSPDFGTQYAWAFGGCNGTFAVIDALGAATTASHNFRIERGANNVFHFYLDGGQLGISLSQSDPRISCWSGGDRAADWLMEQSDYGNGFGDTTSRSQFDNLAYKTTSWGVLGVSATCYDGQDNDFCTDYADGDFDGWTDNGGTSIVANPNDIVTNDMRPGTVGVPWH